MGPESGIVWGFIMAETGISCKPEREILRFVVQNTAVGDADAEYQFLYQCLKLCIGCFVFLLVPMVPVTAVVLLQIGEII